MSIIRQAAFAEDGTFLKGGLHCHTTRSDGRGTPEEVIRLHKKNGYDFLAITDHRFYNYTNFAPDVDITIIPGMEFDNTLKGEQGLHCFHTVCIGPAAEDGNGYAQDEKLESGKAADQFEYQVYLDKIHAKKNLTTYCHPEWSGTSAKYFDKMQGNFAMEIWNSGCALAMDMDKDASYWDEILGEGVKIFGVATDDGHAMNQHCNGWVMVKSENSISAILRALEQGKFYSSCGPEIHDFIVEDGVAKVDCSGVKKIRFHSWGHPFGTVQAGEELLTHGECDISHLWTGKPMYIRASVVDAEGKIAWTNPIWLD